MGGAVISGLAAILRTLLDDRVSGAMLRPDGIKDLAQWTGAHTGMVIGPVLLILFAIAFLAQLVQVGWHVSLEPLEPKLDRLNPLNGVKRIVGKRGMVKTAVSVLKLSVAATVAISVIASEWTSISQLAVLEVRPLYAAITGVITRIAAWVLALLLIIGIADLFYQRWQHSRDLRMTKQEVKDEQRSMEGDVETKGRRLRMARQIALQRLKQSVPKADVIVTNPTHFAVALQYDPKNMSAPRVVAKGADFMAFRIREIAAANNIPIVEKPPLARALYHEAPVGRQIAPEFYEAVAEILAYVYRLKGTQGRAA